MLCIITSKSIVSRNKINYISIEINKKNQVKNFITIQKDINECIKREIRIKIYRHLKTIILYLIKNYN